MNRHASMDRTACIIATKKWGGDRYLFKLRDRNYEPDIVVVHEEIDGTEVCYLRDTGTDWSEGVNEHGIGVVNTALAVGRDEAEKQIVVEVGKKSKDGARIREALSQTNFEDARETACTFKGGVKGHTFLSDGKSLCSIEATTKHKCVTKSLRPDTLHVRTNHGFHYSDAGYTDGDDYVSSVYRRNKAVGILRKIDDPEDIPKALMDSRQKDRKHFNNTVRDTDNMRTTSMMVMNLTKPEIVLYVLDGKVTFSGVKNKLPGKRKPKISVRVFSLSGEGKTKPKKASVDRVAFRWLAGRT